MFSWACRRIVLLHLFFGWYVCQFLPLLILKFPNMRSCSHLLFNFQLTLLDSYLHHLSVAFFFCWCWLILLSKSSWLFDRRAISSAKSSSVSSLYKLHSFFALHHLRQYWTRLITRCIISRHLHWCLSIHCIVWLHCIVLNSFRSCNVYKPCVAFLMIIL